MAQITLSLEEYNATISKQREAEERAATLLKELQAANLAGAGDARVAGLTKLTRSMLNLLRFAIGNMPVEVTKGWPVDELRNVAALLSNLPDFFLDDQDLATEMRGFAQEAERMAAWRAARPA